MVDMIFINLRRIEIMRGIKIYLDDYAETELTFNKVAGYYFSNGFICMNLYDGRSVCYNLHKIRRFDVEDCHDNSTNETISSGASEV